MKSIYKAIILTAVITQSMFAQKLKMSVDPLKEKYLIGEFVDLGISVTNISGSTIKPDLLGSAQINLFREDGTELPYTGPSGDWFSPRAKELNPQEDAYKIVELSQYFGRRFTPMLSYSYFKPGKYFAKIYFTQPNVPTDSIIMSFNVVNPEDDELLAYNSLINTFSRIGTNQFSHEKFTRELRVLADTYPNSVYLPILLETLKDWYGTMTMEKEMAFSTQEEIVDKCYMYGMSYPYVVNYLRITDSKAEKLEKLKELKEKTKNFLTGKHLDKLLKKELEK